MCNYWHGGTIECRGDGFMWDADCDGYDPEDESMPCPECNTARYLSDAKETAETTSYMSSYWGGLTGQQIWMNAITIALAANPDQAPKALRSIGIARPIIDHPTDLAEFIELRYDHRNERMLASRNKREGKKGRQWTRTRTPEFMLEPKGRRGTTTTGGHHGIGK